jgi:hypothetical protein
MGSSCTHRPIPGNRRCGTSGQHLPDTGACPSEEPPSARSSRAPGDAGSPIDTCKGLGGGACSRSCERLAPRLRRPSTGVGSGAHAGCVLTGAAVVCLSVQGKPEPRVSAADGQCCAASAAFVQGDCHCWPGFDAGVVAAVKKAAAKCAVEQAMREVRKWNEDPVDGLPSRDAMSCSACKIGACASYWFQ